MACSFSANQYEHEFRAPKLCNWQVPKWHPGRPIQRKNSTRVIANDRGHLIPGVPKPKTNPWGNFKGTWQLPEKITRSIATELSGPQVGSSRWALPGSTRKSAKGKHRRSHREETGDCCEALVEENSEDLNDSNEGQQQHIKKEPDLEYIPGDLTSPKQQHPSREILLQQREDKKRNKEARYQLNDLYLEKHDCKDTVGILNNQEREHREKIPHILGEDFQNNFEEMVNQHVAEKPGSLSPPSPIIPAFCNFQTARKMHAENLEHQPLPDAVADRAYRRLQAQGILNPGLALQVLPMATGVGVKSHQAGPTQCTKLRVYRPKTCGVVPQVLDKNKLADRPHSSVIKNKMGAMDLAICWDFRPSNPKDEPKRPIHIDGSNDSAGPAVFNLVKTPRSPNNFETGRSGGVFSNTLGEDNFFDKDVVLQHKNFLKNHKMERDCNCKEQEGYRPRSMTRNELSEKTRQRCKSSPNISQIIDISCNHDEKKHCLKHNKTHKKHQIRYYEEEPNRQVSYRIKSTKTPRLCREMLQEMNINEEIKPEYKLAFKAGVPKSNSSGTCTSFDSGCSSMTSSSCSQKVITIPKPRLPYAKKNYNIDTLHPPFACWKGGAGQGGYPEHWRLASVYQHAYKPINQRKRPLLATVFQ